MLHSILLLASFAVGIPELPRSAYVDTEVSTNFPIAVEDDGKHWMTFVVSLVESPSNNVEVAVGSDADGDDVLGVDEADWTFGYDCGRWFLRGADGTSHPVPGEVVRRYGDVGRVERTFVLNCKRMDARWNLAKVTRRGLGVSAEQTVVKCKRQGTCVFLR